MSSIDIFRALVFGLLAGLFVNYLADVLPIHRRFAQPLWWPLESASRFASYLGQTRVWLVQLSLLALAFALYRYPSETWPLWQLALPILFFSVVVIIDIEHRVILHPVSISGAILLGTLGVLRHGLLNTLLGGSAGFVILLGMYGLGALFGRWIASRRGKPLDEIVLGFGDVNLAGVIGLLLGWPAVLGALFLGILAGGFYSLAYILVSLARGRYQAFAAIPYGPFLSLGTILLIALRAYP